MHKFFLATLAMVSAAAVQPASAQRHYEPRSRVGEVANEIARTVEETARAMGTVRDSIDRSAYELRYRGRERFAIDACRPYLARYGPMLVDDVRPYGRRSLRVYGTIEGYGDPYRGRYSSRSHAFRTFTCTVRDDGRVKVKTRRSRR